MHFGNENCTPDLHSGHSRPKCIPCMDIPPTITSPQDYKMHYDRMPNFKDFIGPYKNYKPPGDRSPAVGEKIWGDVPYLPSYLDPMYFPKETAEGPPDNLYFRGPFYKGVSETHTEFVNRGVPPRREYNEYVRHYEEPGMKDEISVTHADFKPPYPMAPGDKTPCLKEDPSKPWYEPGRIRPKNPHAKESEMRQQRSEVVYVDEEPARNFSTEHNDNYICYQKEKIGNKFQDLRPVPEEMFLKNAREAHQKCQHPPPSDETPDRSSKVRQQHCPGPTLRTVSWLLHPKNYSFQNGVMLIPCKCRYDESKKL